MPPNEAPVAAVYRDNDHSQEAEPVKVAPVPANQIRVEDKLYSTEKLAELHPGGPIFIRVRATFFVQVKGAPRGLSLGYHICAMFHWPVGCDSSCPTAQFESRNYFDVNKA